MFLRYDNGGTLWSKRRCLQVSLKVIQEAGLCKNFSKDSGLGVKGRSNESPSTKAMEADAQIQSLYLKHVTFDIKLFLQIIYSELLQTERLCKLVVFKGKFV